MVLVVRVLRCSIPSVAVESWMMVRQLLMLACWLGSYCGPEPGRTFWEPSVSGFSTSLCCKPARNSQCTSQGCIQTVKCTICSTWLGSYAGVLACKKKKSIPPIAHYMQGWVMGVEWWSLLHWPNEARSHRRFLRRFIHLWLNHFTIIRPFESTLFFVTSRLRCY